MKKIISIFRLLRILFVLTGISTIYFWFTYALMIIHDNFPKGKLIDWNIYIISCIPGIVEFITYIIAIITFMCFLIDKFNAYVGKEFYIFNRVQYIIKILDDPKGWDKLEELKNNSRENICVYEICDNLMSYLLYGKLEKSTSYNNIRITPFIEYLMNNEKEKYPERIDISRQAISLIYDKNKFKNIRYIYYNINRISYNIIDLLLPKNTKED